MLTYRATIKQGDSDCDVKQNKLSVEFRVIEKSSKHLKAGLHRPASETPLKWRFAGGPMMVKYCMLIVSILGYTLRHCHKLFV